MRRKKMVFGLVLLSLGVFAMTQYFPFYAGMLNRVLDLRDEREAVAIAWLLILFTAAAGVLLHLAVETAREHKESEMPALEQGACVLYVVAPPVLWVLQAFLYGASMPNRAVGMMAGFFVSLVETGLFFFATRFLFGKVSTSEEGPE